MYLALVVNLVMIWCFGFFFLELLDDCDEESNNDDALASLDDAGRKKLGSDSDTPPMICAAGLNDVAILFLHSSS